MEVYQKTDSYNEKTHHGQCCGGMKQMNHLNICIMSKETRNQTQKGTYPHLGDTA